MREARDSLTCRLLLPLVHTQGTCQTRPRYLAVLKYLVNITEWL